MSSSNAGGATAEGQEDECGLCPPCVRKWARYVPFLGLIVAHSPPSWDDIEKTLAAFALLGGLLLSMVGGIIFEDLENMDREADIYSALYGSMELCFLEVMLMSFLYIYLLFFIDQDKEELRERQVKKWWYRGGSLMLLGLPAIFLVACWQFVMAVTLYFEHKFQARQKEFPEDDYPDFHYGCMQSWMTLPAIIGVAFLAIHMSFIWSDLPQMVPACCLLKGKDKPAGTESLTSEGYRKVSRDSDPLKTLRKLLADLEKLNSEQ